MEGIAITWLLGVCFLTSLSSLICCRILIVIAPKDAPDNERKMQATAVPTSGGIAIAASIILPWSVFLSLWPGIFYDMHGGDTLFGNDLLFKLDQLGFYVAFLSIAALVLGYLDDLNTVSTKFKFTALAIFSLLFAILGKHTEGIFLPYVDSYILIAFSIGILGTALWLFVIMNATNFMDGSNGLAMGTLAIMLGSLSLYLTREVALDFNSINYRLSLATLGAFTTAAILGFLFWNLQGKLYAGDAGSLFGGAVFASLGIYAAQDGNIWFPATLALPFLVDVFMTLLWRARAGHNLLTAHRHHAYQLLIKSGWSHIKTALLWWGLAAFCAAAALWAASQSKSMSAWVFFALLGSGCALWLIQRVRCPDAIKHQ